MNRWIALVIVAACAVACFGAWLDSSALIGFAGTLVGGAFGVARPWAGRKERDTKETPIVGG